MNSSRVIVIGGGAAGFFAAIACAEANPSCRVIILEQRRDVLSKVRISGGGRCNVTHACFDPSVLIQNYPRGGQALRGPFTRFQPRDTIAWFAQHGVQLKTEADGRMFPITDRSDTIVNCLVDAANKSGVEIRTGVNIKAITRPDQFVIHLRSGENLMEQSPSPEDGIDSFFGGIAERVLLATGSNRRGYDWAAALGHTIEPPVPSLFTFTLDDPRLADLAGISVEKVIARILGTRFEQSGPILITHWGLSGPVILKLSAWGARVLHDRGYRSDLSINWLPDITADDLYRRLLSIKSDRLREMASASSPFQLPLRLWKRLVNAAGIGEEQRWTEISKRHLNNLVNELSCGQYAITGKGTFKEEFVTCGGVNLDEVNFKTMESRRCPGLYFAGEILDIDGLTGGFNFQSAWTTGWLAGHALAQE